MNRKAIGEIFRTTLRVRGLPPRELGAMEWALIETADKHLPGVTFCDGVEIPPPGAASRKVRMIDALFVIIKEREAAEP